MTNNPSSVITPPFSGATRTKIRREAPARAASGGANGRREHLREHRGDLVHARVLEPQRAHDLEGARPAETVLADPRHTRVGDQPDAVLAVALGGVQRSV